ncbi:MAG: hypothetical protein BZ137_07895 [Methanosphaera sp. rholeuAM130]|nr:RNase P subunit p30 family protein [Methanosphaera sp.]RAP52929.1 MAG: hypothetical protein BZ137_07895 [Methanosphaera sp. rholeuAM130]
MTNFYDFNIQANEEVIETLENFGFRGACIFYDSTLLDNNKEDVLNEFDMLKESTKMELYHGVFINETNPQLLTKNVLRYHQKSDIIMANGGRENINRTACQMPQIDIINEPYTSNNHSGINHILARMLVENNITINISYRSILNNRGYYKSKLLSQINQLFTLQEKYSFNTIITSGSKSFYDVKSVDAMLMLGGLFDTDKKTIEDSLSTNVEDVIKNIQNKKDSIVDGVKLIR